MPTRALVAAGMFLVSMGALFALQGAGLLAWPADSFMLGQREWALRGVLTAVAGILAMGWAARIGRSG